MTEEAEQNIAVVRRLTEEAFVDGCIEVLDEILAEDLVDHDPIPGFEGRDAVKEWCRMAVEGLSNRRARRTEYLATGDRVIENWVFEGTHTGELMGVPATGKEVQGRGIEIWRVANGKIVERWGVFDTAGALQQLGML